MRIKQYIRYLFATVFFVFILNKFYLRPWVLKNGSAPIVKGIVYSLPNLVEAIMGTIVVTALMLRLRDNTQIKTNDTSIYVISTFISALYVISQELKYHNLGGNNTYGFNDIIASIIGLTIILGLLLFFGFREELT